MLLYCSLISLIIVKTIFRLLMAVDKGISPSFAESLNFVEFTFQRLKSPLTPLYIRVIPAGRHGHCGEAYQSFRYLDQIFFEESGIACK